jgi:hypothetical protein
MTLISQEPLPFGAVSDMNDERTYRQRVEFLLEESSMENVLRVLLPQIMPPGYILNENCFLRPHSGKSDLRKSIPRKIRAFSNPQNAAKIVILHDQDSSDCKQLKQELVQLCVQAGSAAFLIRIVCRELEAWYMGDPYAIEQAYPRFHASHYVHNRIFQNPDMHNAVEQITRYVPGFQKGEASRIIPPNMVVERNHSPSFHQFVRGLQRFLA